ncbi:MULTISPECIES: DUF2938 domain-containing protein [Thiomicrorhabdus]|uniref:DUF2938 domain-containing protein n=1 Tax=Thiomicrorhabdus heinhorstiae TaxID=2748010 RepID=A0ABS0BTG3_9GAMM|nr:MULTISPECIES: DUF2938 domain-containing protein [Thiomicrorhabdus]MBF6057094.1 DUF2938 domain-containing protein [Thiomicrorhabdus heinhorstiae]
MNTLFSVFFIGIGATLIMDLWSILRKQFLRIPSADYGLVGRWIAHMRYGRFYHHSIMAAAPVRGEQVLGWGVHYLTGIAFAALMIFLNGESWLENPTLLPALAIGIATVIAPFFLMQPGMGAGVAASRTSNPRQARIHSLITHAVFGFGLYLSGWLLKLLYLD